jgi:hemolysin activation/secretion protein
MNPLRTALPLLFSLSLWAAFPCAAEESPPQPPVEEATFDVLEIQVEGNTVLPAINIERAVYPFLGEGKSIKGVEQARAALEQSYHEAGYLTVLVDIPEQAVESGLVRLKVTEGAVGRLKVTGSRYFSQGRIRAAVPSLAEGGVPDFNEVQRELGRLAQAQDRHITPVLKAGRTPGKVEVELKVEDRAPLHASLELNNHYSANTSHTRLAGMVRYDNLWQREHSLSLQYQTAPERTDDAKVLSATYVLPGSDGNTYALYAVRSRSNVAAAGDVTVLGNGDIYGARAIVALPGRPGYYHSLTLGADYKDFKESVVLAGADTSVNTPISYVPFTVQYSGTLQGEKRLDQFSASANFSLRGLADEVIDCGGGDMQNEFSCKRYGAQPNYFYVRGDWQQTRTFAHGSSLVAKIAGQLSGQPLVSNEQFVAGGADSVRGYLESEAAGDDGVRGMLELHSPSFGAMLSANVDDAHVLGFIEGAALHVTDALPSQKSSYSLSSAGLGLRLKAWRKASLAADVAWPFKATANTSAGSTRVHFRMIYEF